MFFPQFVVLAMVAGLVASDSDSDSQISTIDGAQTYTNNVAPNSRPTGFYYSVQTYDTPKVNQAGAGYINPYALNSGYGYGLQQPYTNQGLLNAYTGLSPYTASPYTASPYTASPYTASPYAVSPYTASQYVASPYAASPYVASPYAATQYGANPYIANPYVASPYAASPYVASPYNAASYPYGTSTVAKLN